jgi:carbon-monoxide dehydrogenase medium subunit
VFRWSAAETALARDFSVAAVQALTLPADGLNADQHAPAEYRAHLAQLMTVRAVAHITGHAA